MNRLLLLALVTVLVCFTGSAYGQGAGIKGVLVDEKKNPVVNANVEVSEGGIVKGRTQTGFDGDYVVKPLNGGRFDVKFSYLGKELVISDVSLAADQIRTVNGSLVTSNQAVKGDIVVRTTRIYQAPLIDPENPGGKSIKGADVIEKSATRSALDMAALSTQVYQGGNGTLSIGGARSSNTKIIIDGVQLNPGSVNFSQQAPNSVEAITTFSSGIPARYGDASGGLVSITTKGASARTQGNIQYERSVDGYNRNQLTVNLSGPLLRKTDSNGGKRNIVGYNITADGIYQLDADPKYYRPYYVKPDVLAQLEEHPLRVVSTNSTSPEYSTQLVRASDLEQKKINPNNKAYRGQLGGKLDFNVSDNVSVRVGANYFRNDGADLDRNYLLFSPNNFTRTYDQTGRGYIRFTQKFSNNQGGEAKNNSITNAFYTVQADYQRDYSTTQNPTHKHNTFDYGYVGKFEEMYTPNYQVGGIDDATGKAGVKLLGYTPTGVRFTPGKQNPILANYTKDMYAFNPNPQQQLDIQIGRGLRNGDAPLQAYNLFQNVGTAPTTWRQSNNDQVAIGIDASFDIKQKKTTHSVEFGLYYQQQNRRSYAVNGAALWGLMRQFTNRVVNQEVEGSNAIFLVNGVRYTTADVLAGRISPGPNDTILYERKADSVAQGAFDRNLRDKLFKAGMISSYKDYINTDAIDPSFYSLDLFSADDLLNGGQNSPVAYFGYDYTGKPLTGTVNFNDFYSAKDNQGFYTRPIGAYRPNYIAGYLSDYVTYKDFRITLGVRVERFDNNTKVLKDPYSFYAVKTASDVQLRDDQGNPKSHPSNIGGGYVVYVGDNSVENSAVIGYRNGDTWYDVNGRETQDPQVLRARPDGSTSQNLQPVLQNRSSRMTDANYDPNQSFTDYKPQVNAMPRINFSFPLNDDALFYAHYDVMYQRPNNGTANTGAYATQVDYLFVEQNTSTIYGNSNLKPERAIDYEVGFQQRISQNSGVTISGFYKERKDQIQVRPYLYAFPITYYTYGNRDFSTYKGLSLAYELRRVGNISMSINYTLSFAEGTGSSATSANGGNSNTVSGNSLLSQLVAAGLPNLRSQFPLDIDSRHNINAQVDYRFSNGGGPMIGNSHVLENSGINLIFRARSGEPYTKYSVAQNLQTGANNSPVIDGAVNGSRLGGHFGFDINVDKTIPLKFSKPKEGAQPSRLGLNIYAYAQNVLNIRDVRNVYGYTGRPDDDGYLTSPIGLTQIPGQADPQSFQDLYRVEMLNPDRIAPPRTINIGLRLNF